MLSSGYSWCESSWQLCHSYCLYYSTTTRHVTESVMALVGLYNGLQTRWWLRRLMRWRTAWLLIFVGSLMCVLVVARFRNRKNQSLNIGRQKRAVRMRSEMVLDIETKDWHKKWLKYSSMGWELGEEYNCQRRTGNNRCQEGDNIITGVIY